MKTQYLFVSLFAFAAIFIVDYFLVVLIGVFANAFGANQFFYQVVYPYIISSIAIVSIVLPVAALVKKLFSKNKESLIYTITHARNHQLRKSA
ncbi:MAG: hypothetical protein ABFR62_05255 [Bacteroidota bacterium]